MIKRNSKGQFVKGIIPHNKGKQWSKKHKIKLKLAWIKRKEKGYITWNKGKHIKVNDALKIWRENGGQPWNKGKKELQVAWNKGKEMSNKYRKKCSKAQKGKKLSKETKNKLSKIAKENGFGQWMKGKKLSEETKRKCSEAHRGKKSYNYKGNSKLCHLIRNCYKYKQWTKAVFERDNYICQKCKIRGGKLHAHHIKKFSLILEENNIKSLKETLNCEELWNINNGITYCKICHKIIHKKYA